jgi:HK97 family phage portal protein
MQLGNYFKGIVRAAFLGAEFRTSLENPQTPLSYPAEWLLDIFNGGRTDSGIRVSEMTALQVGTVLACVNIVSNGFAALPLHVQEKVTFTGGREGRKKATKHALYDPLHTEPNSEMTSFVWRKVMMVHALLWGNAYSEIQRDQNNQIIGIWPRNPARTRPIRTLQPFTFEGDIIQPGTLIYETTESLIGQEPTGTDSNDVKVGKRRLILAEDMIHIQGLSLDGRLGQSTVWLARQIIGLALATEKYGAKFFGNGARPAGILSMPNKMEELAIDNLRRSWAEAHGGENQFKVAVLEEGVTFSKIAATPEEGQMLETRAYQREEITALFGVPLHMLVQTKGSGKSNTEQASIEFFQFCLNPWITQWTQELDRKLFPKLGRSANRYIPHFETRQLLYPDAASRGAYYANGIQWGWLNGNDIHEFEGLNPIEDGTGDLYRVQVNMQPADMPMTGGPGMEAHLKMQNEFAPAPPAPKILDDKLA